MQHDFPYFLALADKNLNRSIVNSDIEADVSALEAFFSNLTTPLIPADLSAIFQRVFLHLELAVSFSCTIIHTTILSSLHQSLSFTFFMMDDILCFRHLHSKKMMYCLAVLCLCCQSSEYF